MSNHRSESGFRTKGEKLAPCFGVFPLSVTKVTVMQFFGIGKNQALVGNFAVSFSSSIRQSFSN